MSTLLEHAVATITTTGGPTFPCRSGDTLLRAALRAGVPASYECNSGGCGTCAFVLRDGMVDTVVDDPPGLSARDRRKGRLLGCQALPVEDCTVDLRLDAVDPDLPVPTRHAGEVVATRVLTRDLSELSVRTAAPATFLPGQFAMLGRPGGEREGEHPLERAYSMSNVPNPDGLWQFVIKRVPGGAVSPLLTAEVAVGDELDLDGPYGHAHLRPTGRDVVCIAGGSGLAPIVSIARGLAALPDAGRGRLDVIYGGRMPEDLCMQAFIEEVAPALGHVSLVEAVSDGAPDDWPGARGFVHEVLAAQGPADLTERDIYVAGPPPMTDAVVRLLVLERQVPAEHVHFDRFF